MNKELKLKKKIKLRNKKLLKKYPWLKPYNVWTGKIWKDYDYEFTWYNDIPDGWRISFGKFLLEDLDKASKGHIRFEQIKEKYGELRIYASTTKKAHDVISKYETISRNICIYCGKPNVGYTKKGWITPVCRKCFYKNKWNRDINYEESIDMENVTIAKEYKYTRFSPDGDKTFTVDISDTVDKIVSEWNKKHK